MFRHPYHSLALIVLLMFLAGVGLFPLGAAARPAAARPQATFTVDSDSDAVDASPGDGSCADNLGRCTLRAAIQEVNARSGGDTIVFAGSTYIFLDSLLGPLPAITQPGTTLDASSVWNTADDEPGVNLNCVNTSNVGLRLSGSYGNVYGLHIFNCAVGIEVDSGHNMIGGPGPGQRNVISGNLINGIDIYGSAAQFNNVQGNWIGLSMMGDTTEPNGQNGILVNGGAANNTIGGDTAAQGNYISGNTYNGVYVVDTGTDGTRLGANTIGLGADGSTRLGNGNRGVIVREGPQNTWIGGGSLAGNTIVSNGYEGVGIQNAHWHTIQGNTIRENLHGIYLQDSGDNQVIANTITQNTQRGVLVGGAAAVNNLITANSIFANGAEGIDLINGGNNSLAAPTISAATPTGAAGTSCASCMVDLYSDSADEGEVYHGSVNADASGDWVYTGTIAGPNATATNRDSMNNTSRFSAPVAVTLPCTPISGVTITGPANGQVGANVCFTATVAPDNATEPIDYLWDPVPDGQGNSYVCYMWTTPGTYVITVTASNCGGTGSAQATHTVVIGGGSCVPVTGVTIGGPTTGLVGVPYGFGAAVVPANATAPIDYAWTPAPGGGQGTANATYTWSAAGTYNVGVAVSNCGGAGTGNDDHSITISAGSVYRVFLPTVVKR